jgi:uncharacterized protein (TIGR02285 family)
MLKRVPATVLMVVIFLQCFPFLSVQAASNNSRLVMEMLDNHVPDNDQNRINVETRILQFLQQQAASQLDIRSRKLSNLRIWEELKHQSNYCVLNKMKNPERESFLHFARLPTSIYPPIQLISTRQLQHNIIDLALLLKNNSELKVGVVTGRSYGPEIDPLIQLYPGQFFLQTGDDAAERLTLMLTKGRIDAIIEFSAIVDASLKHQNPTPVLYMHQLLQQPLIRGFIACNKSEQGAAIIRKVDETMQTQQFRNTLVHYHREYFNAADFRLIQNELQRVYQAN